LLAAGMVVEPVPPTNSERSRGASACVGRSGCWAEGCYFKPEEFHGGHASRSRVSCLASSSIYACNHRLPNCRRGKLEEHVSAGNEVECFDAIARSIDIAG